MNVGYKTEQNNWVASMWVGRNIKREDAHCFTYVAERCAWLAYLDSLVETPPSRADEPLGILIDFSDGVLHQDSHDNLPKCINNHATLQGEC
jgi:hypothetical protein